MVFGFFTRKNRSTEALVEAGPSTAPTVFQFPPKQQHTPAPSIHLSPAASDSLIPTGPADTPSPPPEDSDEPTVTDPSALHTLIASVPAQTLHAYTLAHLSPSPFSPLPFAHQESGLIMHKPPTAPNPRALAALTAFFASLAPPPKLHCVRCHKGYFELENTDRSCLVPHDDESAIVERVRTGMGTEWETLFGCCGGTVEGDGDMGPPDGWCYEGRHTTDTKRARFRADSSPQDDKLTTCAQLRCNEPPLPPRGRVSRKRSRKAMEGDEEEGSVASSISAPKGHRKSTSMSSSKGKARAVEGEEEEDKETSPRPAKRARAKKSAAVIVLREEEEESAKEAINPEAMDIDTDPSQQSPSTSHPSPPKSPRRVAAKPKPRAKPKTPASPKKTTDVRPVQKSPLSASFTAAAAATTPPPLVPASTEPRSSSPRRKARVVEVEIQSRSPSRASLAKKGSVASLKATAAAAKSVKKNGSVDNLKKQFEENMKTKPQPRAGRSARVQVKPLGEVVDTSVDGEGKWS